MNVYHITNLDQPEVQPYARLTEAQLRNRLEPDQGIFICESPKVIRVALNAGYRPLSMLTEEKFISTQASDIITRCPDMPVYTGSRQLLSSLTGYELTRGVLCAMHRPQLPTATELLTSLPADKPLRVALLDNVVNSTNIGAIFRAAAGLGMDAVLLAANCCDPLIRRSVRVSMGTVFQIPWAYIDAWHTNGIDLLHSFGLKVAALALVEDSIAINDPRLMAEERLVIVLGTEGDGLAHDIINKCDYKVSIPMANHVDSLNVAGAASIAFWQLCGSKY